MITFVAAFPLAPIFALIVNVFKLRQDSIKINRLTKRPTAIKVLGLGPWTYILETIVFASMLTNVILFFNVNTTIFSLYNFF